MLIEGLCRRNDVGVAPRRADGLEWHQLGQFGDLFVVEDEVLFLHLLPIHDVEEDVSPSLITVGLGHRLRV